MIWRHLQRLAWAFGMWVNIRLARFDVRDAGECLGRHRWSLGRRSNRRVESIVRGLEIRQVLCLRRPLDLRCGWCSSVEYPWVDFVQTVAERACRAMLSGAAVRPFLIAISMDRFPFLCTRLLPVW